MKARSVVSILVFLAVFAALRASAQVPPEKQKIICDHAAPPRGMHYVCKSQCDCRLEGKLKNDEDGIVLPQPSAQDLKITTHTKTEMNGHLFKSEDTLYMKGESIRREFHAQLPDGSIREQGFIDLCDSHRAVELDPQRREYRIVELGEDGLAKGWQERIGSPKQEKISRGGPVEVVTESIDTHETKTILGHLAHHWITTEKKVPGPGACTTADQTETDGWYIDYKPPASTCSGRVLQKKYPIGSKSHAVGYVKQSGCSDRFTFTGEQVNHGMPVLLKHVSHLQGRMQNGTQGDYTTQTEMEVTDLSTVSIDGKTFEVPAGYKRVARLKSDGPPRSFGERLDVLWDEVKIAAGGDR